MIEWPLKLAMQWVMCTSVKIIQICMVSFCKDMMLIGGVRIIEGGLHKIYTQPEIGITL